MAKVHMVFSRKGGVGKTTITVNLAAVVAEVLGSTADNPRVLVASIDPQQSAIWWAERAVAEPLNFDWDQMDDDPDRIQALPNDPYDHIFVDAPGSLARPAILARAFEVADDVIVPAEPEPLSHIPTLESVEDFVKPRNLPYRVVRNNWDRRDGDVDLKALTKFLTDNDLQFTNTVIRHYKLHVTAAGEGRVVTQYPSGRAATECQKDFLQLALELGYGGKVAA